MVNDTTKSALPSLRTLLTSLFNSLPPTPPPAGSGSLDHTERNITTTSNPLKTLSPTHRSLFITLHVLFPSLLLQALDLLDRNLVTKVIQITPTLSTPDLNARKQENTIYLVRSAQSTHHRHHRSNSSTKAASSSRYSTKHSQRYIVRLEAWNCSCAAFAFSAFPGPTSAPFVPDFEDVGERVDVSYGWVTEGKSGVEEGREGEGGVQEWSFGGLSSDGTVGGAEGVPCCKHLLACILADRWDGVLASYVKEMRVGREEMAGLGTDG